MEPRTPSAEIRQRLLDAAGRLFHEQGYRATGVNQLLRESGVAKASFYHHFPSKEALVVEVLTERSERILTALREAALAEADPERRVDALFATVGAELVRDRWRGCTFLNLLPEFPASGHPAREVVAGHKSSVAELIVELTAAMPSQAGLSGAELRQRADTLNLLLEGALVQAQVQGHEAPLRAARDAARALLGRDAGS